MDTVKEIYEKLYKKSEEAESLIRQYNGLLEFEKEIKSGVKDLNIDVVINHWNGQKNILGESRKGGRLTADFGIEKLNETIQTLLLAEIGKRKEKIEEFFKLLGEDMKLND